MKATVQAVQADCNAYIYASVWGPLREEGRSVRFDAAFCPTGGDPPGLTPLVLASIALGHKVEIDVEKCGESSYAIVALRLSEKTQAARVLRLAAEMLPHVARGNWYGAFLCTADQLDKENDDED